MSQSQFTEDDADGFGDKGGDEGGDDEGGDGGDGDDDGGDGGDEEPPPEAEDVISCPVKGAASICI